MPEEFTFYVCLIVVIYEHIHSYIANHKPTNVVNAWDHIPSQLQRFVIQLLLSYFLVMIVFWTVY